MEYTLQDAHELTGSEQAKRSVALKTLEKFMEDMNLSIKDCTLTEEANCPSSNVYGKIVGEVINDQWRNPYEDNPCRIFAVGFEYDKPVDSTNASE